MTLTSNPAALRASASLTARGLKLIDSPLMMQIRLLMRIHGIRGQPRRGRFVEPGTKATPRQQLPRAEEVTRDRRSRPALGSFPQRGGQPRREEVDGIP